MAKDPAFLFYPGDWQGGTMLLSRHQKGCYMDLLIAQFHSGPLSLEEIKAVLSSDFGHAWPALSKKFITNEKGLFFNERMATEIEKRKKFSDSRRKSLDIKNGDMVNIYLLFNPDKNLYKIGSSKFPALRLQEAQKKNPVVTSFWVSPELVERVIEKTLHEQFSEKRKYFDWFQLNNDDIQKVLSLCASNYKSKSRTGISTENANENKNGIEIQEGGPGETNHFPLSKDGFWSDELPKTRELNDIQIGAAIEYIGIKCKVTLEPNDVQQQWEAFKIQQFGKHEWYNSTAALLTHFRNSVKLEIQNNGTKQQSTGRKKTGTSAARIDTAKNW